MTPERRQQPRVRLGHLAYIHVEPDSGAIVLDVSDGGIGFHSVAPFHNMGTISIRFSLHADKHLKVSSEIAWVDETGKKGGLKLTDLSSDVRSEIRTRLLTAPLRSKKESALSLADTHQDLQEIKLRTQSASISVPQPIEPPVVGISQQRITSTVSQTEKAQVVRRWWGSCRTVSGNWPSSYLSSSPIACKSAGASCFPAVKVPQAKNILS